VIGSGLTEQLGSVNVTVNEGLDEMNSTLLLQETSGALEKIRAFDLTLCSSTAEDELRYQ